MRFLRSTSLLVLLLTAACDDTFSPIEASALRYSLYGYLDASADTQWIRVTPVRPVAVTTPEPLDVRVTLEHLGTRRVVELRDSVFRQTSGNPELGGGAFYSHNFWTAEPIEPGASYRLTVAKEGSPPVETLVQVPPDYDLEIWLSQTQQPDLVHLTGLEHVGLLFLLTKFTDTCGSGLHRAIFSAPPSSSGERHARILSQFPGRPGCTPTDRLQQDIQVIGSGAPWPTRQSGGGRGAAGRSGAGHVRGERARFPCRCALPRDPVRRVSPGGQQPAGVLHPALRGGVRVHPRYDHRHPMRRELHRGRRLPRAS